MRKKLLIAFVVLVVGLASIEGLARVRYRLKYGSFEQLLTFTTHEASGLRIPVPGRVAGPLAMDSLGFRSPELEQPKPAGRLRVAFLGASTTFCVEAPDQQTTWPHLVLEGLRAAQPGASLDYLNAGVSGYTTVQSLLNLEHRVAPLEPDVIVIYHATNDITRDTRELAIAQGVHSEAQADPSSWMARHSLAWFLVEKNLQLRARVASAQIAETESGAQGSAPEQLEFDASEVAAGFRPNFEALVARAQEVAPLVVLISFAPRVRHTMSAAERLAACNTSLFYMPYMTPDGLLEIFDAYNDVLREVASATGTLLVEAAGVIPGDGEHYADSVHLIEPGLRRMAQLVTEALLDEPRFQALLESSIR